MKIKEIEIQGFRGFNDKRSIGFHEQLTLISAPNSCGKTSISEALEWLLYGITSKVEKADFKDEYKGSYRNSHLPKSLTPYVKATFMQGGEIETLFHAELLDDVFIQRFVNKAKVQNWPMQEEIFKAHSPFILQHALKYLLLVPPRQRFKGFARLLGLEKLDLFLENVVSLCTKPDACIPPEVGKLIKNMAVLESQIEGQSSLSEINKAYKKGPRGFSNLQKEILSECKRRVSPGTEDEFIIPQLEKIREEASSKIFEGHIELPGYSELESQANKEDEKFFLESLTESFIEGYLKLLALASIQNILERTQFFNLGIKILGKEPTKCPFCGRVIDGALLSHIHDYHKKLTKESENHEALKSQRDKITDFVADLKLRLIKYNTRQKSQVTKLLELKSNLDNLKEILVPRFPQHFNAVKEAISQIEDEKERLGISYDKVLATIEKVETSIKDSKEDSVLIKELGDALTKYIAEAHSYIQCISNKVAPMSEAQEVLKQELDVLAGTEDISVLISLLKQGKNIKKKLDIQKLLDGLKELRKSVEQYCAKKVLNAISEELTAEVMEWYGMIKTKGDPDVHFAGFDIERTRKGDLKSRRVQIKAKSYGKELVSAVSSLSESKLNALGLCVSIATNLKGESPFDFLIIDDPIQSWDAEHEDQFIEIINKLVEKGKQIILMSHNADWIDRVRSGTRSINGYYYQITGYTEAGPHIAERPWAKWSERLDDVDAILNDQTSDIVKLQQAEQEMRFVIMQLTSEIFFKKKDERRSFHNLNPKKVRKMLIECGLEMKLIDRIAQAFETIDDAHHNSKGYTPNRQRIRMYHSWCHELANELKALTKKKD